MAAANVCTHNGCGKSFSSADESPCTYHPGGPVFHDTMKSWSCCNKQVASFDEFMAIPGCTTGVHSTEVPAKPPVAAEEGAAETPKSVDTDGVETYGTPGPVSSRKMQQQKQEVSPPSEKKLEQDPDNVEIPLGATCKRNGCNVKYSGSREGCVFHPGEPAFHDGSKGWSCCKRRVLEFDEFLKIPGCREDKHLFVGDEESQAAEKAKKEQEAKEEPRMDFYQNPSTAVVTVFAKRCDKLKSKLIINSDSLDLDLYYMGDKHFKSTIPLFSTVVPEKSSFEILSTKIEISLHKLYEGEPWAGLRAGEKGEGMIRFGVGGRVGTVGGKEIYNRGYVE